MECQPTDDIAALDIVVNGATRRSLAGQTLLGLVEELQLEPSRIAIEMNRRIVKRAEWGTLRLASGAQIEIVQFVGGG